MFLRAVLLALVAPSASGLAATSRRCVLRWAPALVAGAPALASANIGGQTGNALNLRLGDSETDSAPGGETLALEPATREALAAAATKFGEVGASIALDDGAGADAVQAYFRSDYGALTEAMAAASAAAPKGVRKTERSFGAATASTREAYDTADFVKAADRYGVALDILVSFCARAGIVSDRPPPSARPAAAPVTRRTYLPGPFQLL